MKALFDIDSPVIQFLGRMADLIMLNLVFVVCCIPVVTIGPALTALHYVALKLDAGEEPPVVRSFFKSFRQNLRQGVVIWLLLLALGSALGYDLYTLWGSPAPLHQIVLAFSALALVGLVMVLLYVFPLLARFDNSTAKILRSAMALSIANFPKTVSMFMLAASTALLTFYTLDTLRWGILAWLVIGFALVARANAFLLNKIFAKYIEEG